MARLFDDASTQYLSQASPVLTGTPLTMACWFNSDDAAIAQLLLGLTPAAGNGNGFYLNLNGAAAGDPVQARTNGNLASSTSGYSINTWHHACGVWASATDRRAFIDGGSKGTNATNATPGAITKTHIGRRENNLDMHMSGRIAEAAIWNIDLADGDVATLAKGYSPLVIRPANLVAYWPLMGRTSPEIDWVGKFDMTLNNGPTQAAHPRIIYPSQSILGVPTGAAPPAATPQYLALLGVGS
jgi:hypothetical protein